MSKTCVERINAVHNIDAYRAIVAAIGTASGPSNSIVLECNFPDPVEYAVRIEGGPSRIEGKAKILGPNAGDGDLSIASRYENGIKEDLNAALARLDTYWEGAAADKFMLDYMADFRKHLQNLADACEKQRDAANKIKRRIIRAHSDLEDKVREMVNEVVGAATAGAAGDALVGAGAGVAAGSAAAGGVAFSFATAGVGAVLIGAGVAAWIIKLLITHHGEIEGVIDSLDTDLGLELIDDLEAIPQEGLGRTVDRYVSKSGWHPPEGG